MEKDLLYKIVGLIVIIALVGSMLAAVLIYMPENSSSNNNTELPQNNTSKDYDITFDAIVLGELNSIRIYAQTDSLNKTDIDLAIGKIEGVAKVRASEFRTADINWAYFAEIDLKKGTNVTEITNNIFALDFFNGVTQAVKKVSINTPKEAIELYNSDLNITRNFTFDYTETFAIASLDTRVGDEITLSGTISLSGKDILFLELIEQNPIKTFTTERKFELTSIKDNNLDLKKTGTIFIDKTFVNDLNKTFDINKEIYVELSSNRNVGDLVNIELTIYIQRGELIHITGTEK